MGFKLNLTGEEIKAAQGEFTPLAEGTYGAVIYEAKFKESKAGNPMYELTFKVTDGPEGVGRQIRGWFTITPKALFKVVELNKAVGFPYPNKETPAGEFEFADADEYLGKQVNLVIIQEPYESVDDDGNDITAYRNNIKKVVKYNADDAAATEAPEANSKLFL